MEQLNKLLATARFTRIFSNVLGVMFFLLGMGVAVYYNRAAGIGMIAVGFLLTFVSLSMTANQNAYRKHYDLVRKGERSIERIALLSGVKHAGAVINLAQMIRCGVFPGASIDEKTKRIVLPGDPAPGQSADNAGYSVAKCAACGAKNSVPAGSNAKCEFCGGEIE